MTFEIYFLLRLIIKGNLTHLAQKSSGSKINGIKMYKPSYHKNILKTYVLLCASKSCYVFKTSL